MTKKFLLASASLFGAIVGANTSRIPTTRPIEVEAASVKGPTYTPRTFAAHESKPAKPITQPAPQQKVVVRQAPLASLGVVRFIERPGPRRVKYGKHRWVMVG